MSPFVHGLYITVLGMGLVFLTLGLIMILMTLLGRLLPEKSVSPIPLAEEAKDSGESGAQVSGEMVAIIAAAVALAHEEQEKNETKGDFSPASLPGGWVLAGRNRRLQQQRGRRAP